MPAPSPSTPICSIPFSGALAVGLTIIVTAKINDEIEVCGLFYDSSGWKQLTNDDGHMFLSGVTVSGNHVECYIESNMAHNTISEGYAMVVEADNFPL